MLPVIFDVSDVTIALVGGGAQACRRLRMLDASGADNVRVFAPDATPEMRELAGARLRAHLPDAADITAATLVFAGDLDDTAAQKIAALARAAGKPVNVEDITALCDFHVPSIIRRGDLLLTASTGGKSPALARRIRAHLEARFPESWGARLDELAAARADWRRRDCGDIPARTDRFIDEKGWLA